MSSSTTLLLLLVALTCLGSCSGWRVLLYRDTNHRGGHIEMSGSGCKDVPSDFNDKTSSVNTRGGCVRLYQSSGCTGKMVELFPGSSSHGNLGKHGMNDRTSSVGNCPRRRRDVGSFQVRESED